MLENGTEFPEGSVLTTLVPHASDFDVKSEVAILDAGATEASRSPFLGVPQRQLLYYDENVDVYIILSVSVSGQGELESLLSRLAITLEASAGQTQSVKQVNNESLSHAPARELIFTNSVDDIKEPLFVFSSPGLKEGQKQPSQLHAVWRLTAYLSRPRTRSHYPYIAFFSAAQIKPTKDVQSESLCDEYLPSKVPGGINLLESFQDDPTLAHVKPYLSANRVSRVPPATPHLLKQPARLESGPLRTFRIVPGANFRIRYSKLSTSSQRTSIIASLEFELTPHAEHEVILEEVALLLDNGAVDSLLDSGEAGLPLPCRVGDKITLLYRLRPNVNIDHLHQQPATVSDLEVFISAKALVSDDCQALISMKWRTMVDHKWATSPGFTTSNQRLERTQSPSSSANPSRAFEAAAMAPDTHSKSPTYTPPSDVGTNLVSSTPEKPGKARELGIIVTVSGPSEVRIGEVFRWGVFMLNQSSKPRKLALSVFPKRRRSGTEPPYVTSVAPREACLNSEVAKTVLDDAILYEMQSNASLDKSELVCLSADVRVGPLAPGACHTADLQFVALASGVLQIHAIRVVDLLTEGAVDIHDLPSVICKR